MFSNLNWSRTKNNVKTLLTEYSYYILSVCDFTKYKINDNYTFELLSKEKDKDILLPDDEFKRRITLVNRVRDSFNKLSTMERKIIYWTYLDKEHNYDDRFIANNLGFSLGYYYIQKKKAIIRFAYALGIEVI